MYKILLIENQIIQFEEINDLFKKNSTDYILYPEKDHYVEFIDLVRVYLNVNYYERIRKNVYNKIIEKINIYKPDIFIIDHILVGCHLAKTGLDLAISLRESNLWQPIIFLSRTSSTEEKVMKLYPRVDGVKLWITKGFAGKEILLDEYFKRFVLAILPDLITKATDVDYLEKLNSILEKPIMREYKYNFTEIAEKGIFSENQKKAILKLSEKKKHEFNSILIKEFLEVFNEKVDQHISSNC